MILVVDFNTCSSSLTVEILENPDILVEISITPETCI